VSVINALGSPENYAELLITNALFLITIWLCERNGSLKHMSDKLIVYDRIELIVPQRRQELMDDIQKRTGLEIKKIDIGAIDFLHDTVMLKVYYDAESNNNTVEHIFKIPKSER
jgi:hypothetical protein